MPEKSPSEAVYQVDCSNCHKSFQITASIQSTEAGDEEIAVNCPYCEKKLIVKLPRSALVKETIFRGMPKKGRRG